MIGRSGIWFLKAADTGWQVIPLNGLIGEQIYTSIPVDLTLDAPAGGVSQQLLAWLVRWYQSAPSPVGVDKDFRLLASLDAADPNDARAAIAPLLKSTRADQYGTGLAAAIHLGSVDALFTVAQRAEELRSNPKLMQITDAIHNYFKPDGSAAIAPLQQIAALHSDIPGLDAAAGSALQKIGTKDVLPAMALLLDSHDPQAQLRAARFFSYFAMSMDEKSSAARQEMPSQNSAETPAQYAQFWRSWWAATKADLGIPDSTR
jgi:hypothetical protein